MITNLPSRRRDVNAVVRPVVVFTDGAWEQGNATAGAVIIDGSERQAHSILVPVGWCRIGCRRPVIK